MSTGNIFAAPAVEVAGRPNFAGRMEGEISDEARLAMLFEALLAIEDEREALNARARDIRAMAKAIGFDVGVLTEVVRRARKDPAALAERDVMVACYAEALGQPQGPGNPGAYRLIEQNGHDPAAVGKHGSKVAAALVWAGE